MSEATLAESSGRPVPRGRFRVGLADLIGWVLGAGVAAAVFRDVETGRWFAPGAQFDLILGTTAAILAISLGLVLLRQAIALSGSRPGVIVGTNLPAGPGGWRRWACSGSFLAVEAALLGREGPDDFHLKTRTILLPASATLAMAGVVAGLSPCRVGPRKVAWLSVVWAGAAGVAIASTQVFIPYLVLLGLEAFSIATTRLDLSLPRIPHPGLHDRVASAGLELIPGLLGCLFLGLQLSRELRRPAGPDGGHVGTRSLVAGILATAAGAAWLVAVTVPRLHEHLAEGLWMALGPPEAAVLVIGLAGLALGPAARAADRPALSELEPTESRPRRVILRVLFRTVVALILLNFILVRVFAAAGLREGTWTRWAGWAEEAYLRFLAISPSAMDRITQTWRSFQAPEWLVVAITQVWIAWRIAVLLVTPVGVEPAPLDASLCGRHAFGRFAIRWAALTTLMVSSLPVLFVAGLVVLHFAFRVG